MHAAKQADIQQVFDKYDDVSEQIEVEVEKFTGRLNELVEKEESGQKLTSKEGQYKKQYSCNL